MITQPQRIFVVGHMGAGKALFGEALAKKLSWQYIDANPSLERYIGRSLDEILGKSGAAAWHRCEAEIIAYYASKTHVVVVLEEAVIGTAENRKLLSAEFVIYLQVSTSTQIERMQDGRAPLFPIAHPETFLNQQHLKRNHFFEAVATLIIASTGVEADVQKTMEFLKNSQQ